MPIIKSELHISGGYLSIFNINESEQWLVKNTLLSADEKTYIKSIKIAKRKQEFIASRYALQSLFKKFLTHPYKGTVKNEFNKPYLIDYDYNISFSHSHPFALAYLHKNLVSGIDIETPKPILLSANDRIFREQEVKYCNKNLERLCLLWTIKEAAYKCSFLEKIISLKENIHINVPIKGNSGTVTIFDRQKKHFKYNFFHEKFLNHYICVVIGA